MANDFLDYGLYFFNDRYDDKIVRHMMYRLYNSLYSRALTTQGSVHNLETIEEKISSFKIDTELNRKYKFPLDTYTYKLDKNIIPFYNEKRGIDKYHFNTPISLLDIAKDYKTFSKRILFNIGEYVFYNLYVMSMQDGSTLLIIYTNSNTGISKSDMLTFIADDERIIISFENQSDLFYGYLNKNILFDGNKIALDHFPDAQRLVFNKKDRINSWCILISAKESSPYLLAQSETYIVTENDKKYFVCDPKFVTYVSSLANNCRVYVMNNWHETGAAILSLESGTIPAIQIPFEINPTNPENIVIHSYDEATGRHVERVRTVLKDNKIGYPNVYELAVKFGLAKWIPRSSEVDDLLNEITYGNGLYVAVGDEGTIVTSPDGITWTKRTSGVTDYLQGITYGNGLYVAVGENGIILTSPDGITWTKIASGVTDWLEGITYANGLFVAVGYNDAILTSPGGITWTKRTGGVTDALWDITYGNGLYVAVGLGGTIVTSPDGITWTKRDSGVTVDIGAITYDNGLYVAVGDYGNGDTSTILTSPDTITWTKRTSGVTSYLRGIAYGNGLYVATGADGTVVTSPDGITWTQEVRADAFLSTLAYYNGLYVAVGDFGAIVTTTSNISYQGLIGDLLLEWYEGTKTQVLFDNCLKEYLLYKGDKYLPEFVQKALPECIYDYKPLENFVYDYDDYQKSPQFGDVRGYTVAKLMSLLHDDPTRFHRYYEQLDRLYGKTIFADILAGDIPGLIDRSYMDTSSFTIIEDDIYHFSEPHTYLEFTNQTDLPRMAQMFLDGHRYIPSATITVKEKTYVFFPKDDITASTRIMIDMPKSPSTSQYSKANGTFILSDVNVSTPFPNPKGFKLIADRDLIFYDAATKEYLPNGKFEIGFNVDSEMISNPYSSDDVSFGKEDITLLTTFDDVFFRTNLQNKFQLEKKYEYVPAPPKGFHRKIDSARVLIRTQDIAFANFDVGVTNTDNYRWGRILDLEKQKTFIFPNFREDPSPGRFRVYSGGTLLDPIRYTYTPPAKYGDDAVFDFSTLVPEESSKIVTIEYLPNVENILFHGQLSEILTNGIVDLCHDNTHNDKFINIDILKVYVNGLRLSQNDIKRLPGTNLCKFVGVSNTSIVTIYTEEHDPDPFEYDVVRIHTLINQLIKEDAKFATYLDNKYV